MFKFLTSRKLTLEKHNKPSSSPFSDFFRKASAGEKKRVFIDVARKASATQRKMMEIV